MDQEDLPPKNIRTQLIVMPECNLPVFKGRSHIWQLLQEIDNVLVVPEVLALVGRHCGHSNTYQMLIVTVPDLVSIINKEAALKLKERVEEKLSQIATLNEEFKQMESELKLIQSNNKLSGKKRNRN